MFDRTLIVAGVARSGTSWLGEIINSSPEVAYRYQPLFSHAFKDRLNIDSSREDVKGFLQDVYLTADPFVLQQEKRAAGLYPIFAKNPAPRVLALKKARYHYLHIKFLTLVENLRMVAIVRNPCAVLASWMANPKEFPLGSDPWLEWRLGSCKNRGQPENFFGFYKWREATNLFLDLQDQFPARVLVVQYEKLVDDPLGLSRSIFGFSELDFGSQTRRFLEDCNREHSESPYAVFKHKTVKDQWRQTLDPRIAQEIEEELTGTRLARFLA